MVSPINIQLFAVGAVLTAYTILYVYYSRSLLYASIFNVTNYIPAAASVSLYVGGLFVMIGLVQTVTVKFLLGLNGTATDIDLRAWTLEVPFPLISKLIDRDFLEHYDFRVKKRNERMVVLRYLSNDRRKVRLAFTPDPADPSKSILAASGYGQGYYAIYRLDSASELRDRIVKDFQNWLREIQPTMHEFFHSPLGQTTDLASDTVRDYSLEATEGGPSALARSATDIRLTYFASFFSCNPLALRHHKHRPVRELCGALRVHTSYNLLSRPQGESY
jgi:hypothetical protein